MVFSTLLDDYINYIKTVPLIFELDNNLNPKAKYQKLEINYLINIYQRIRKRCRSSITSDFHQCSF